jgi:16S rRNA processing protein RimM
LKRLNDFIQPFFLLLKLKKMDTSNYFYFGYIVKSIGHKGVLRIQLDVDDPSAYEKLTEVSVVIREQLVNYPIDEIKIIDDKANISFRNIDNTEVAKLLQGCSLYLPLTNLPKLKGNQFYFHEVTGFEVHDHKHGLIGTVQSIIDQTSQAILEISFEEKEILVPITDEIVKNVDRKKKCIEIEAPDGLIEIYL